MGETIINGIDVSECGYYNKDNEPFCCEIWDNECEAQDCYFKQSKRLKQQIEAYQLSENEAKEIITELKHKNKRLQEENEELKKYQYTQEYLQSEIEKRQKTIEEIRNIAKPIKENTCFGMYCGAIDWILDEVNEVLNDRD